jgi:tRNA A-37 threonylcarbamoyl transferase component Bud32/tetratricopeptide (TPR) repeat protein
VTDLRDRLASTLGVGYRLERELGGGGMSRVFIAEEIRFHRRVVIKVLAPELAMGVSADRFQREIELAATLQQANVIPLLTAGDVDGLAWYSMPFVEGESLRSRLARGGLTVSESINILRDVARALAYAHQRGIVHRDIKPENVLLSGGTAVVADFGIAKAIAAARTQTGHDALTSTGMSLGTPAYMAPEQAAGDGVDARADLYAWGMVAYEMLAGRHPFADKTTAQQLIAAQIAESPKPLDDARPEAPAAVASLVMRCLAKDPNDRPPDGAALVATLESDTALVATSLGTPRRAHGARWSRIAVGAVILLAIGVIGWRTYERRIATDAVPAVLVLRFENRTGDPRFDAAGLAAADWIAQGISETGEASLLGMPGETAPMVDSIARAHTVFADRMRALRLASGATEVVAGEIARRDTQIVVSARLIGTDNGHVLQTFDPVVAKSGDPLPAADALRARILGTFAAARGDELAGVTRVPPTYAAYREYMDGTRAYDRGDNAEAYARFTRAYALDSAFGYALVRAAYAAYLANSARGRCVVVDSLGAVLDAQHALAPFEDYYFQRVRAWCRGDWDAAYRAAQRLVEFAPHSDDAAYVAARSALYLQRPNAALRYFKRVDFSRGKAKSDPLVYRDLAAAYHQLGDYDAELRVLRDSPFWGQSPGLLRSFVVPLAGLGQGRAVDSIVTEALTVPRRTPEVFVAAIGELRRHGQTQWADSLARRFVAWQADSAVFSPAARQALHGYALLLANRNAEARVVLDSAIRMNYAPTRVLPAAGVAAARTGDRTAALAFAAQLDTFSTPTLRADATYGRAQIAAAMGDRAGAVRLLQQALPRGVPYYFGVHYLGTVHLDDGDPLLAPLNGYAPFEQLLRPKG